MNDEKRTPTNTGASMREADNGLAFLGDQMVTGRAVENQEEQGQREFVASDVLPLNILTEGGADALIAAGVVLGDGVPNDPLFRYATLPPGWTKRAHPSHAMWSHLVDDKGRQRASIFYKAAFYDRKAHMRLDARYSVRFDRDAKGYAARVYDGEAIIYETNRSPTDEYDRAMTLAYAWIAERFSDWESVTAYWEEESRA